MTVKDIKGYEGFYTIDEFGKVYSRPRNGTLGGYIKHQLRGGYYCVELKRDGVSKKHPIHVLLAEVFLGHDRNSGFVVDHKDNNPLNNAMSNLQIITQRENNTKDKKRKSNHAGVVFNERNNKWLASISYNYRRINLGYYEKEEQAAQAYNKAVKQASEGQDLNALYPKSVFSSQYKGVFFDAAHNKWLAQATKDNRQRKIGRFNSEIEAYNAILQFKRQAV